MSFDFDDAVRRTIAEQHDRIAALEHRNVELRGALQVASADYRHLQAENAKLRELVKALLTCATDGECDECRMNSAIQWHVGKAQLCDGVWEHLRELGVEVDE